MNPVRPVAVEADGTVAVVTIGDGRRHNALGGAGWDRLARLMTEMATCETLRAVVVRGAGDTFCAGSDIAEWLDASPAEVDRSFARMEAALRTVERCPVPVIAEIRGTAAGAGCQLALACDLRVMACTARIGMPIARLGILPSPAFASRLTALAGPAVARELFYTGRLLDGPEAVRAGLVDHCVPDDAVAHHVAALLADITRHPPAAVRAAKAAVAAGTWQPPRAPYGLSASYPDFTAAVAGFLRTDDQETHTPS